MVRRLFLGDAETGTMKYLMVSGKTYIRSKEGWVELNYPVPCLEEHKIDEEEAWKKIVEERREKMWKRYSRRRKND